MRIAIRSGPGLPGLLTANITWLPLNAQNLAKLSVPIPAGFRQAPLSEAVGPVFPRLGVGLGDHVNSLTSKSCTQVPCAQILATVAERLAKWHT